MKKLKFLLMLLLTMFLFESTTLKSYAAITDITEIPEIRTDLDEYYQPSDYLTGKVFLTEEDNGKMRKITIPEYSYVEFFSSDLNMKISLYEDEEKKNKIVSENSVYVFLPKGDYYNSINSIGKSYRQEYLRYGRISMDKLMKGYVKNYIM